MFTLLDPHTHRDAGSIAAGLPHLDAAPTDLGILEMLVARHGYGEREVLDEGRLDLRVGLVGDTWAARPSKRTLDGSPHPDMQLNLMSTRVLAAIADRDRWPLAGDQLLLDLDLSPQNLPVGSRLHLGEAVVEITDQPHAGCALFAERFGPHALRFVNTGLGKERSLRGRNARVVVPGTVTTGDLVRVQRR